jgi:hypothetical protein
MNDDRTFSRAGSYPRCSSDCPGPRCGCRGDLTSMPFPRRRGHSSLACHSSGTWCRTMFDTALDHLCRCIRAGTHIEAHRVGAPLIPSTKEHCRERVKLAGLGDALLPLVRASSAGGAVSPSGISWWDCRGARATWADSPRATAPPASDVGKYGRPFRPNTSSSARNVVAVPSFSTSSAEQYIARRVVHRHHQIERRAFCQPPVPRTVLVQHHRAQRTTRPLAPVPTATLRFRPKNRLCRNAFVQL